MIDDGVVGCEYAVRQPVVAHELPDILDRIELRAFRWQRHDCDVGWHDQVIGEMPSSLIDQQRAVAAGRHADGDFGQVQGHRFRIAPGQNQARGRATLGADRTEDVGGGGALVSPGGWPGAAARPAPGDLVLLADPCLIGEPDLYVGGLDAVLACDRAQTGGETYGMARPATSAA